MIISSTLDFYVYAYLRKDGTPYYIGKGTRYRAWSNNHTVNLPTDRNRIVIVEKNLTEIGALAIEKRLIRWYGRKSVEDGILHNRSEGGGATNSGTKYSDATKIAIGNSNRGKKRTPEAKEKMRLAKLGKKRGPHSASHREKLAESIRQSWPKRKSQIKIDYEKAQ